MSACVMICNTKNGGILIFIIYYYDVLIVTYKMCFVQSKCLLGYVGKNRGKN